MATANTYHLYMDEADVHWPGSEDRVLMEGGLLCKGSLRPRDAQWYNALLRKPHCTDRALDKKTGQKGAVVIRGLAKGGLSEGSMVCLGARYRLNEGMPFNHVKESLVLGLLVHVIQNGDFTSEDCLALHPERWDESGGMVTQGRFEGILGALRWLPLPRGRVPRLEVKVYPGEPHILMGQGVVDHVLWNLRAAVKKDSPDSWRDTVTETIRSLGLKRFCRFEALPTLTRPGALVSASRIILDEPDAIDWRDLCHEPPETRGELLTMALAKLDSAALAALLEAALDELEAWVDQPRRARMAGVEPKRVFEMIEQLSATVEGPQRSVRLPRQVRGRLAYNLARARTHAGMPREAWDAWDAWQRLRHGRLVEPQDLQRELTALRSLAVVRSDLFLFDKAAEALRGGLALLDEHFRSFPQCFDKALTLGTLGQNLVLAGRPSEAVPHLQAQRVILRDAPEHPDPERLSFPWTWLLVACGRGASLDDPTEFIVDLVQEINKHSRRDLETTLWENHYLLWGMAEASTRRGLSWGALPESITVPTDKVLRKLTDARRHGQATHHPVPLVLRAWAQRSDPSIHNLALVFTSSSFKKLTKAEMTSLMDARTMASWFIGDAQNPKLRARFDQYRRAAERALQELDSTDPRLAGVKRHLEGFVAVNPDTPGSGEAYLALGGY